MSLLRPIPSPGTRMAYAVCCLAALGPHVVPRVVHRVPDRATSGMKAAPCNGATGPMRPRLWDQRLNYYPFQVAGDMTVIQRWRLEKRDPSAAVSDVVQPIVYRINSSVPARWVPWVTRGIKKWISAFEAIGFRHALVVRTSTAGTPADTATAPCEVVIAWTPNRRDPALYDHVPRS